MCQCPKCRCYSMEVNGEPFITEWGYCWNASDTDQVKYFSIELPYKCTECGYEENDFIEAVS